MTTFDLAEVKSFAADLSARLDRCDNGEGMECAGLEATLQHYAKLCCEYREQVRQWGRAVFTGHVAFDPKVEKLWLTEGVVLYSRAHQMLKYGETAEVPCFILESQTELRSALWGLHQLVQNWVTPKLSVGPAARRKNESSPSEVEEARRAIAALPPLPPDWQPSTPQQRRVFRKLKRGK